MNVKIKKLSDTAIIPQRQTQGSAGMDLHACLKEPILLHPGDVKAIPTGISTQFPYNYELQVRPRSGLALKHGLTVLNSPGTIDADFTGEIKVILINLGLHPFPIYHGDRIAQAVFQQVIPVEFDVVEELKETERGSGGFGSTGVDAK